MWDEWMFVCGADGVDVCINARTMETREMPQRGRAEGTVMQVDMLQSGLLVCWGSSLSCSPKRYKNTAWFYRVEEHGKLENCCCSLKVFDARSYLAGDKETSWLTLPCPPISRGHIRPDATMFVKGTCVYLHGGSSAFDTSCCDHCSTVVTGELHRILDLAKSPLAWEFENDVQDGPGVSGMGVVPLMSGEHLLVGGTDKNRVFANEVSIDDRVLKNVTFSGVAFAQVVVPQQLVQIREQ
mgnify:CR=1 FL=1